MWWDTTAKYSCCTIICCMNQSYCVQAYNHWVLNLLHFAKKNNPEIIRPELYEGANGAFPEYLQTQQ